MDGFLQSGDSLQALWQANWSSSNGPLIIADLIDPDDRNLFDFALEMTDHRDNNWPTIIARGSETIGGVDQSMLLILDPVLTAASVATTAVPEPTTLALTAIGLLGISWRRRKQ